MSQAHRTHATGIPAGVRGSGTTVSLLDNKFSRQRPHPACRKNERSGSHGQDYPPRSPIPNAQNPDCVSINIPSKVFREIYKKKFLANRDPSTPVTDAQYESA
jgi:hypothetical protein